MKLLFLDVETAPNLAWVWGFFKQNIGMNQVEKVSEMICWAAKFKGRKTEYRMQDDEDFLMRLWEMLDETDVVIHYNGDKFDIPTINKEFLMAGMQPPSPYKSIDLLKVVKKKFRFARNKLGFVLKQLGFKGKLQHEGFQLWLDFMARKPKALAKMKKYNIRDTEELVPFYERLLPWIPNHPNIALYDGSDETVCPKCGGELVRNGHDYTAVSKFQRYKCKKCGANCRGRKNLADRDNLVTTISGH